MVKKERVAFDMEFHSEISLGRLSDNCVGWISAIVNPIAPRTYIDPPLAGGDTGEGIKVI